MRNSDLDASNFFANSAGLEEAVPPPQPVRRRGGRARSSRTARSIFGDYEGLRDAAGDGPVQLGPAADLAPGHVRHADLESVQSDRHRPGFPDPRHRELQRRTRKLLADPGESDRSGRAEGAQRSAPTRTSRPPPSTTTSSPRRSTATAPISSMSASTTHFSRQAQLLRPLFVFEDQLLPARAAARTLGRALSTTRSARPI